MELAANAAYLRERARDCLRRADRLTDPDAIAELRNLAIQYQTWAKRMDARRLAISHLKIVQPPWK